MARTATYYGWDKPNTRIPDPSRMSLDSLKSTVVTTLLTDQFIGVEFLMQKYDLASFLSYWALPSWVHFSISRHWAPFQKDMIDYDDGCRVSATETRQIDHVFHWRYCMILAQCEYANGPVNVDWFQSPRYKMLRRKTVSYDGRFYFNGGFLNKRGESIDPIYFDGSVQLFPQEFSLTGHTIPTLMGEVPLAEPVGPVESKFDPTNEPVYIRPPCRSEADMAHQQASSSDSHWDVLVRSSEVDEDTESERED